MLQEQVDKGMYGENSKLAKIIHARRINLLINMLNKEKVHSKRILDVGGGDGLLLSNIHSKLKICIDVKSYGVYNFPFMFADARCLPFKDNTFDIVIAPEVLEHIDSNVDLAINELKRVSNSIVIITYPVSSTRILAKILMLKWKDINWKDYTDGSNHKNSSYKLNKLIKKQLGVPLLRQGISIAKIFDRLILFNIIQVFNVGSGSHIFLKLKHKQYQ